MIHEITIKVHVPGRYRPIGYGRPQPGRPYLRANGGVGCGHDDYPLVNRILLEEVWQAPDWIIDGAWVYRYGDGSWWVTDKKPVRGIDAYGCRLGYGYDIPAKQLAQLFSDTFTPPPVDCIQVTR
jgi:hypothetical protein